MRLAQHSIPLLNTVDMAAYQNIMEALVEEEVKQLFQALPARVSAWIHTEDLVTYALNRLPPLYANTSEGVGYQLQKGRSEFKGEITQAVHRAFAIVQNDPLRRRTPLQARNLQAQKKTDAQEQSFKQLKKIKKTASKIPSPQLGKAEQQASEPKQKASWLPREQLRKTTDPLDLLKQQEETP